MKVLSLIGFIGLLFLNGCSGVVVSGPHPPDYPTERPHGRLGIPPGHLPSPGECRIWYPGMPPGQQPPPGPCSKLQWEVPPGAWLIHGATGQYNDVLRVSVYHERRPRVIISVRYYELETGRFLREEKGR